MTKPDMVVAMAITNKRIYCRWHGIIKIAYLDWLSEKESRALTCNFSRGGMLFRTHEQLDQGADIEITKLMEPPDEEVFSNIRKGCARVIWCDEVAPRDYFKYGIGVRYVIHECNLCGTISLDSRKYKTTEKGACLCDACCRRMKSLPDDNIKRGIEDIILGNVI